jgi:hypothetical protein
MSTEMIDELETLMGRVRDAHGLRDKVAHCTWTRGRKPGTIKPLVMSARTKLKETSTTKNNGQRLNLMPKRRNFGHWGTS